MALRFGSRIATHVYYGGRHLCWLHRQPYCLGVLPTVSNNRPVRRVRVVAIAMPCALVLLGLVWIFAARYVPSHRVRLYQDPISSIQSIGISPGNNFPLVNHEVVITNYPTIQQIMTAIRSAQKYSPNHPAIRWSCALAISSLSGTSYVAVNETVGQGTILDCATSPHGLIFDTLQSSSMGHILEQAVGQSGQLRH